MKSLKINYLAVLVAGVVAYLIGMTWYMSLGHEWMAAAGLQESDFDDANYLPMVVSLFSYLATGYVMALLFTKLSVESAMDGLKWAFTFWIGFSVLAITTNCLFEMKPDLIWINAGFSLLYFLATGLILGAWRKYNDAAE